MKLKKTLLIILLIIMVQLVFIVQSFSYSIILNTDNEEIRDIPEEETQNIYSESAILMDQKTGKILYEKNIYDRKYPASTTKILTAIIAIENCDLSEVATASFQAVETVKAGYTNANIKAGESFTIQELLDVMMIVSANEAATIIAEHISGSVSEFAKLMNQKAKEIGCLDSNFVNANGVHDENHYSTAYDMALIARYCMQNEKYRELINKRECSLPISETYINAIKTEIEQENEKNKNKKKYKPKSIEDVSLERNFRNTNSLLREDSIFYYPYCIGGKTGFTTPAKNCLISSSNKDGFETIAVVLHAENTENGLSARYTDTIKLFEYGYNNYNMQDLLEEYDLIEYSNNKSSVLSSVMNNENKEIDERNMEVNKAIIMVISGGILLLIVIGYFLIMGIKKYKNRKLYSFKIS